MTHKTRETWLKLASAIVIAFGLLGLLGTHPATSAANSFLADLAFWPLDGGPNSAAPELRLFWAVLAGLLCGWGLLLWQITTRLYPRDPELARSLILTSICVWFVIDSLGSVVAGAPINAVMNLGFLLLFVLPLLSVRQRVAA